MVVLDWSPGHWGALPVAVSIGCCALGESWWMQPPIGFSSELVAYAEAAKAAPGALVRITGQPGRCRAFNGGERP
jgi:hypothetical protein